MSRARPRSFQSAGRGPGRRLRRRGASRAGVGAAPHLHPPRAGTAASRRSRGRAGVGRGRPCRVRWVRRAEVCARTPSGRGCTLRARWLGLVNDLPCSGSGAGREQAGKWGSLRALREGTLVPPLGGTGLCYPNPRNARPAGGAGQQTLRGSSPEPVQGVRGRPQGGRARPGCVGARQGLTLWPSPSLQERDALRAGGHGAEGVGGWHPACGLWGFRADHLSGSGRRTGPSDR